MHFIEHIIEPTKLLLAWQSLDEKHRTRYIVAEINHVGEDVNLTYLVDTADFIKAQKMGFESYPAFQDIQKTHHHVLDAFMRRLPPRSRGDFPQYLEALRLKSSSTFSDFALLGYSGAKLPSDGFSIIHPFNNADSACELLIEAAGYRHVVSNHSSEMNIGTPVAFSPIQHHHVTKEVAIDIMDGKAQQIGYVPRGLISTFIDWMDDDRIADAWIEKVNGTSDKPRIYIFIQILSKKMENSCSN